MGVMGEHAIRCTYYRGAVRVHIRIIKRYNGYGQLSTVFLGRLPGTLSVAPDIYDFNCSSLLTARSPSETFNLVWMQPVSTAEKEHTTINARQNNR
jgi:hypothetical protein